MKIWIENKFTFNYGEQRTENYEIPSFVNMRLTKKLTQKLTNKRIGDY